MNRLKKILIGPLLHDVRVCKQYEAEIGNIQIHSRESMAGKDIVAVCNLQVLLDCFKKYCSCVSIAGNMHI
jgi:hypothetical protein